jgi:putative ABC transport system ATP-binding protein
MTSTEVMEIFTVLNQQGITVIVVTHEADIAAFARRRIVFRDGVVIADERSVGREGTKYGLRNSEGLSF